MKVSAVLADPDRDAVPLAAGDFIPWIRIREEGVAMRADGLPTGVGVRMDAVRKAGEMTMGEEKDLAEEEDPGRTVVPAKTGGTPLWTGMKKDGWVAVVPRVAEEVPPRVAAEGRKTGPEVLRGVANPTRAGEGL